uniref:ACAD9/ACADV-like C-terminal domain-containing protein n=1 Tax=Sphenodon punctatus TaxID=8508 RepID=A0A8D0HNQ9_SPHPU
MLCDAWCAEAYNRIVSNLTTLRSNDTRQFFKNLRSISKAMVENGGVVSPNPLGF